MRRIDSLADIAISSEVYLPKETSGKMRVSSEAVYLLGKNCIETIWLNKEKGQGKIILEDASEQPIDLLISSIFEE